MASIINLRNRTTGEPNGHRAIQFIGPDKKRETVRIGKMNMRQAETVRSKIETLLAAKIIGCSPDNDCANWLAGLPDDLYSKLVRVGLTTDRVNVEQEPEKPTVMLKPFLDDYINKQKHLKERSLSILQQTRRVLIEYFGETRDISTITEADAEDWRNWLLSEGKTNGEGLAVNTANDRCKKAKRMFRYAIKSKFIAENPFIDLCGSVTSNEEKLKYITREQIDRVLAACLDVEWKTLIALCRFGGLRNPSETLILKWEDIDLQENQIVVHSPKTQHHKGKDKRIIPLYHELREVLEERKLNGATGYVLNHWQDRSQSNMRTQFMRILKRAGLKPWPRLFHNLRASRQTELQDHFSAKTVCNWMGNSEQVSMRHYSMTTQDHFKRALQKDMQQAVAVTPIMENREHEAETK